MIVTIALVISKMLDHNIKHILFGYFQVFCETAVIPPKKIPIRMD